MMMTGEVSSNILWLQSIETSLEWQWFILLRCYPHCGQDDDDDDDDDDDNDNDDDDDDDNDDDGYDDNDENGYSAVVILTVVSG